MMINLFFQQIDNGELVVFEQTITRDIIEHVQIASIYSFNRDSLTISIYSKLKEELLVPQFDGLAVDGISIDIDEQGNIRNIKSHVTAKY